MSKCVKLSEEKKKSLLMAFLAFLLPVAVMLVLFAGNGIYPFGDRSFLVTDMWHQYMPFFSEFVHKIRAGEGLSYSYNVGIGSNFLALYVYYLACPFNWLVFLVPEAHIMEFMSYLVIVKIGLIGMCAWIYLQKSSMLSHAPSPWAGLLCSLFYALSGFVAAYNWNIMWLDCVYLFPLILLGLERLVKERKPILYCVTLFASIYTNFYISIMICIFLVLYFGWILATETRGETTGQRMRTVVRFGLYSLLAGGMACVLLIPEVLAILETDFGNMDFPDKLESYFPVLEVLARHCMCVATHKGLQHWPNIYSGAAAMVLVPAYVLNTGIPMRRRFGRMALAGALLLGFTTNYADFIWHGLNFPDSLPARQSFLYVFLVIVMCYEELCALKEARPREILNGYLAAVAFLLFCEMFIESDDFRSGTVILNLCFVTAYAVLLYLYRVKDSQNWAGLITASALVIALAESGINMGDTSVGTTDRTAYLGQQEDYKALYREALDREDGFFRLEKFTRKTKNDGTLTGYPTASVFSSTMNSYVMDLYDRLGMRHSKVYYGYDGATAFTSALLNVHYMFGESDGYENSLYTPVNTSGDITLYECENTLPFGYVAPTGYDLAEVSSGNAFVLQNDLVNLLGVEGKLFVKKSSTENGDDVIFQAKEEGIHYAVVTSSGTSKITVTGTALEEEKFSDLKKGCILYLGSLEAGDKLHFTNGDENDETPRIKVEVYRMSEDVLTEAIAILGERHLEEVCVDNTRIEGKITLQEPGRVILSVPYEKGWTVRVNGEKTNPALFGGTWMALDLEPGEYTLECSYVPHGKWAGVAVSAVSILIFAFSFIHSYSRRRIS